ncbi:MAG TPA: hypothetical protein VFS43_15565 [Polyangiaceae bacterium]|nr:hypothetical protein [Polyangiaceae bacterium]
MNRSFASSAVCTLAIALAAACGSSATPAPPPGALTPPAGSEGAPAPTASVGPAEAAALEAWRDDMSKDQKVAFMKKHVVPRMSKVFEGQNGQRSGEFGCKTCHGAAFKNHPQDVLPKLTLRNGKITAFDEKPQVAKFMAEQVVPNMAAAMGMKPYDPATHQGFGCGGCHTVETK